MTENKRFIEFATQNTDDGKINNGFYDMQTDEYYYTKDSENAKKICDMLNELNDENTHIKNTIKEMYNNERTMMGKSVLKQLLEAIQ